MMKLVFIVYLLLNFYVITSSSSSSCGIHPLHVYKELALNLNIKFEIILKYVYLENKEHYIKLLKTVKKYRECKKLENLIEIII